MRQEGNVITAPFQTFPQPIGLSELSQTPAQGPQGLWSVAPAGPPILLPQYPSPHSSSGLPSSVLFWNSLFLPLKQPSPAFCQILVLGAQLKCALNTALPPPPT